MLADHLDGLALEHLVAELQKWQRGVYTLDVSGCLLNTAFHIRSGGKVIAVLDHTDTQDVYVVMDLGGGITNKALLAENSYAWRMTATYLFITLILVQILEVVKHFDLFPTPPQDLILRVLPRYSHLVTQITVAEDTLQQLIPTSMLQSADDAQGASREGQPVLVSRQYA
jgi:hypothetical protein